MRLGKSQARRERTRGGTRDCKTSGVSAGAAGTRRGAKLMSQESWRVDGGRTAGRRRNEETEPSRDRQNVGGGREDSRHD